MTINVRPPTRLFDCSFVSPIVGFLKGANGFGYLRAVASEA